MRLIGNTASQRCLSQGYLEDASKIGRAGVPLFGQVIHHRGAVQSCACCLVAKTFDGRKPLHATSARHFLPVWDMLATISHMRTSWEFVSSSRVGQRISAQPTSCMALIFLNALRSALRGGSAEESHHQMFRFFDQYRRNFRQISDHLLAPQKRIWRLLLL